MHNSETVKELETALEHNNQSDAKAIIQSVADKHDWLPLLKEAVAANNREISNEPRILLDWCWVINVSSFLIDSTE